MISLFAERYGQACARHSDLVAVHQAPDGAVALLLRHTLVPLSEEHAAWERDTRVVARDGTDDPRAADRRPRARRRARPSAGASGAARRPHALAAVDLDRTARPDPRPRA